MAGDHPIEFVTSVNYEYYEKYGHRLIRTFLKFVDPVVRLTIYHEAENEGRLPADYLRHDIGGNLRLVDLARTDYAAFERGAREQVAGRIGDVPKDPDCRTGPRKEKNYNYRWDALTFGRKACSFIHAARCDRAESLLFWVDSDIVFLEPMSAELLRGLFGEGSNVIYFGRERPHTETGFFAVDLATRHGRRFVENYAGYYSPTARILGLPGWTDSHAFDAAFATATTWDGWNAKSLSTQSMGHVMAKSPLGRYFDHQKGPRKQMGHSPERE